jgi:hypothetical protein
MASRVRRVLAGAAVAVVLAAGLVVVQEASADSYGAWTSQFQATLSLANSNCAQRSGIYGHAACVGVHYAGSGVYSPNSRWFRWDIEFTNHTCPAEYHIGDNNYIYYADWAGTCW